MDELLTSDDVARRAQVSPDTVRFWRHANTGPRFIRVGRYVRYRREDVESWLTRHEVGGVA
jgi:excisionase family DNA binding protein